MKKKKIGKKLVLNKESIARLNPKWMEFVKGGFSMPDGLTCEQTGIACDTLGLWCGTGGFCTMEPEYCVPINSMPKRACQN
ncbi:MAG: class I lanthipeptide [Candidatus Aminicenantes bacterium]|nr:class I lanthipeptide [Candidatus Aminicenantes bacterium]